MCRVLDWFHIAMKFRAIEVVARRSPFLEAPGGRLMEQEVLHAKWLIWHGKYRKGIERLERMRDSLGEWSEGEYADLHTHLDQTRGYLVSDP